MNKNLLKSHMASKGDTQAVLAKEMGLSLSRLNAKINGTSNAEFTQTEIAFIASRYKLSPKELEAVFLIQKYLNQIPK